MQIVLFLTIKFHHGLFRRQFISTIIVLCYLIDQEWLQTRESKMTDINIIRYQARGVVGERNFIFILVFFSISTFSFTIYFLVSNLRIMEFEFYCHFMARF